MSYCLRGVLSVTLLIGCNSLPIRCQSFVPAGSTKFAGVTTPDRFPHWDRGILTYIATNDSENTVIRSFDRSGAELSPKVFAVPGATTTHLEQVGRTGDGVVVACGTAYDREGRGGGFVAWIGKSAAESTIIRTFPYVPYLLAVAPDNTVWTQGLEMVKGVEHRAPVNADHGLIRHFENSGKEIGSFIPRSSLPGKFVGLFQGMLAVSEGRVGWYSQDNGYIEVARDGNVTRYPLAPGLGHRASTLALTENGAVLVTGQISDGGANPATKRGDSVLYMLNRSDGQWKAVKPPPPVDSSQGLAIHGVEGNMIAFAGFDHGTPVIHFFSIRAD